MPRGPHGAGGATDDHAARPMTSVGWTRPILRLKTRTDVSCQLLTEAEALSPHAFESFQNVVCPAENVRPATTGNRDSFPNLITSGVQRGWHAVKCDHVTGTAQMIGMARGE
jgi:hypothetical protein